MKNGQPLLRQIYQAKAHGYDVREYKLITKDNYELTLHRLVHPAELLAAQRGERPPAHKRKPYLLLHGLLGTSASFVQNVKQMSNAPVAQLDLSAAIERELGQAAGAKRAFEHQFRSTANWRRASHDQDPGPSKWASAAQKAHPNLATTLELNFENDLTGWASSFRQAHRKFQLPDEAMPFVSNSLAFTLANLNYDVWMLNMRGNYYSRKYNGRLSASQAEYWNFDLETLVREDLLASIKHIKQVNECDEPIPPTLSQTDCVAPCPPWRF